MSQDNCTCSQAFKYYDECGICGAKWSNQAMINMPFKTLCCRTDKRLKQIIKSEKYSDTSKATAQRIIDARITSKVKADVIEALTDSIEVMSAYASDNYFAEEAIKKCRAVLELRGVIEESDDGSSL